ncbi:Glucose--fructose oxidoreductase precursor [Planctomycetes bacterium Pan216]|uniref:Glucose--fructose oxidoreductase n=1 Tax=Kolteria novifilia TaxID=2527975 RepID=A0A518BBA2_9BACT|nr:Glucose--fructose oxidoreductase precursor [Planctomycetes bacterium Pan216]
MAKTRWGILSTAKIAVEQVIPALKYSDSCEVVAIASRRLPGAQQAAERLGIPNAHGAYDDLLDNPDVDIVYNPLPNHLHVPWTIKALEAGKHVLCEKPIGLSAAQGQELVDAGRRHPTLKLMEAFMYRHHPQWRLAHRLATDGSIGELRTIQTFFSFFNNDPENIRSNPDWGGGALMDIGCYPISLSRFLFGAEPTRVLGTVEFDPELHIDRMTSGVLEFERGTSTFTCSTQLADYQRVNIVGTEGRVEIEVPFNAPIDRPCRLWHQDRHAVRELTVDQCNQYTIQGDLFSQAVLNDTPVPTPIEDAVSNMLVIEAILESGRTGSWAPIDQEVEAV